MRALDPIPGAPRGAREEAPRPAPDDVVGLLLCGGRSRRMGVDKARLEVGGQALMEYPLGALREVAGTLLLACGPEPRYAELGHSLVLDPLPDGGPLAGLVAGLERAQELGASWVAVLAVDLPRAEARTLRALLDHARRHDLDACLLGLERGSQPTFAVYRSGCAAAARASLEAGERRMVAFHSGRSEGRPLRVACLAPGELGARDEEALNLNTPEDLLRERALATGGRA